MANPIPRRLTQARQLCGLSQRQLGIQAGIDPGSASPRINQYERGKHTPDYSTLSRLAEVLAVPVPYFYAEDDVLAETIRLFGQLNRRQRRELLDQIKKNCA